MTHLIVDLCLWVLLPALIAWYLAWRISEAETSTLTIIAGLTPVTIMGLLAVLLAMTWGSMVSLVFLEFLCAILWLDISHGGRDGVVGRLLLLAPLSVVFSMAAAALVMRLHRRRGDEA